MRGRPDGLVLVENKQKHIPVPSRRDRDDTVEAFFISLPNQTGLNYGAAKTITDYVQPRAGAVFGSTESGYGRIES